MKAILTQPQSPLISAPDALIETTLPDPTPGEHDLLVEVKAISVNPVDTKIRASAKEARVLGWDVSGVVRAVGPAVTLFAPGDEVFYAGSITRPGANSELHVVDERIVGRKPSSLGHADAAAIPLTAITAWELLFDRVAVAEGGGQGQHLLIIGAAGGVGSMLTQLARKLTQLTVIGTASRPETAHWVGELGAHHVIDHSQPLKPQLEKLGIPEVGIVISLTHTDQHYAQIIDVLAPQGQLALIDDPASLDAMPLKRKSISLHWELMFTRSMFQTPDMIRQHELLQRVSQLLDQGVLRTTTGEHYGRIDAANLRRAHGLLESGKAKGKIVLEGF
ncbi:zinc-binding alcohol dehydrogenase family protein [Herbaspirillum seropedicae]|uniref:Zinc-type alcohol dehydrogenase-like protein n=1 Tax=Herbaspirillum seropedicae (strain SmR1) TaxID=757424 RepID=D8J1I0_HERSS|nr:zinc-binding alcohol dehydrogenase family protein [Herbaspirillum seropedicae]ADJ62601.1 zinc-containing alcohol dehydrogenase protein [Herbaspirillum seropedicae SmR1]AKN64712.1 NADPH:quinone reductase [Herbaspirillum seropedicae]NQE30868.1 NADPH:quinone reductase [Herbaspirillum seropedicae]UMU20653.1 zinc-binding alcohol dehydrogenase family protein [Herbaspirillum seropedicae]